MLKHDSIEGPGSLGQFLGRGGWDLRVIEGGTGYKAPAKEMGWSSVSFTPAGAADPLFCDAPSPPAVFEWHVDTYRNLEKIIARSPAE